MNLTFDTCEFWIPYIGNMEKKIMPKYLKISFVEMEHNPTLTLKFFTISGNTENTVGNESDSNY